MASPPPALSRQLQTLAVEMGAEIRAQRKKLKVTAVAAAEAAGMSRVTWHRIEKGEVSVTLGAYMLAANVVGLAVELKPAPASESNDNKAVIPVRIALADYPQLRQIAWQVTGVDTLTPVEALDFYERNWRYVHQETLTPKEQALIKALRLALRGDQTGRDGGSQGV